MKLHLLLMALIVMLPIAEASLNGNVEFQSSPIQISNVIPTPSNTTTTISWTTSKPGTSSVDYGATRSLGQNVNSSALETAHTVTLQGLSGTLFYRITSCDAGGDCAQTPIEGIVTGPLFITTIIPNFVRSTQIDIAGRTKPGASISVNVNGADVRKATITEDSFLFRAVPLPKQNNTVILTAELQGEKVQQTYSVNVDAEPPKLNISIPAISLVQSTVVNVSVSETVNLTVTVERRGAAAPRPSGLRVEDISSSKVKIVWDAISGIDEYGVYRNGTRIAIARASSYEDAAFDGNQSYRYQVSAMGVQCVEGDRSDSVTVQTNPGVNRVGSPNEQKFSCVRAPQVFLLNPGKTNINIMLDQGENFVKFTAKDRAGFTSVVEHKVLYDTGAPRFVENNILQLSPAYDDKVAVKGKLTEAGSVTAFVNGKAQKTVPTEPDGTFKIDIELQRTVNLSTKNIGSGVTGVNMPIDTGTQWANRIRLEAVDFAGQKAQVEGTIQRALCGSGSKIEVHLTEPFPDMLNPRLLVQGLQSVGMAFNYTYRGGYNATILTRQINIKRLQLSPEFAKQYDNNLVSITTPQVRSARVQQPKGEGYLQVQFGPLEDPWSQLTEKDETDDSDNAPAKPTMFEKEQRLSEHRKGECKAPGLGCMKLFLELEIPFQEVTQKPNPDPLTRRTPETISVRNEVQRTCIQIEVPVDVRVNPDMIPSGMLKATSELLGTIIEGIDNVLGPLQTVGEIMFYTCAAGTVASAVPIFMEKWNCQYRNIVDSISGKDGKFDEGVAAIGACETAYPKDSEKAKNCMNCQNWKSRRATMEKLYRQVCDRIFCPAAPSLQYYIKIKGNVPLVDVTAEGKKVGQLGSDCKKWLDENKGRTTAATGKRIPPRLFFTYDNMQQIYNQWLTHQDDKVPESGSSTTSCAGLHAADADCCGYEYMQEWSSACGVSAFGSGPDTFDEIKESTCLSAEKNNQNFITGKNPTDKVECNKLLNSASGFCEKDGGESTTTIPALEFCCSSGGTSYTGKIAEYGLQGSRQKQLYVLVIPQKGAGATIPVVNVGGYLTTGEYDIKLGYITETIEFDRNAPSSEKTKVTSNPSRRHTVSSSIDGFELDVDIRDFFTAAKVDLYHQKPTAPVVEGEIKKFKDVLCEQAGYKAGDEKCPLIANEGKAREIYEDVMASIGSPDQEYIVRPSDGLINSARCICLPTLIAYLKQWRNIMAAVRNCIQTILLTGDGEAGVCQAVVSQYACDLLYDAVACFTQKFTTSGPGARGGFGPFGDILGAATSTGTELARSVESRYGETSMYKSIFVDRKLVHSICMFAFTGTWNFDLGAAFDAAVDDIPIESQALMTPCSRRFDSFNPSTSPKGLVTWIYHFGVGFAAGADAQLELHLKCSGGFKCREIDGFARGKCDCERPEETVIQPEGFPSQVRKEEIISEEIFHRLEGAQGEGQRRWDSAYLVYRWHDGKQYREEKTAPCSISQVGGAGAVPSFCRFDPATVSFRCQLGDIGSGISFLRTAVGAPHKIPEDVFAIGEPVNVTLDIKQEYPAPVNFKNNKHLEYVIRNQNGIEVDRNVKLPALSRDGDYTVSSLAVFGIPPAVTKEWFEPGSDTERKDYRTKTWTSANPDTLANGDGGVITAVRLATGGTTPAEDDRNKKFILELEQTGSGEKWTLYDADLSAGLTLDRSSAGVVTGIGGKRSKYLEASGSISDSKIVYTSVGKTGYAAPETTIIVPTTEAMLPGTITITLGGSRVGLQSGEKRQILIEYKPPQVENPCPKNGDEPLKPQRFTITYTSYDADNFGERSDQISVDPNTEQSVQKTQAFFAVCTESGDKRLTKLTDTAGNSDMLVKLTSFNTFFDRVKQELDSTTKVFAASGKFDTTATGTFDDIVPATKEAKLAQLQALLEERLARDEQNLIQLQVVTERFATGSGNPDDAILKPIDARVTPSGIYQNGFRVEIQKTIDAYKALQPKLQAAVESVQRRDDADKLKTIVTAYVTDLNTLAPKFINQQTAIDEILKALRTPASIASKPATTDSSRTDPPRDAIAGTGVPAGPPTTNPTVTVTDTTPNVAPIIITRGTKVKFENRGSNTINVFHANPAASLSVAGDAISDPYFDIVIPKNQDADVQFETTGTIAYTIILATGTRLTGTVSVSDAEPAPAVSGTHAPFTIIISGGSTMTFTYDSTKGYTSTEGVLTDSSGEVLLRMSSGTLMILAQDSAKQFQLVPIGGSVSGLKIFRTVEELERTVNPSTF